MSSGSVTISYTTIAEVALVAALVGGIAYIGSSKSANAPHPALAPQLAPSSTNKSAKGKKKKASSSSAQAQVQTAVVEPVVEVATAVKDHVVNAAKSVAQQPAVKQAVQQAQQVVQNVPEGVSTAASEPSKKKAASKKNKGGNKAAPAPELKPDATKYAEQKVKSEGALGADMVDPEVDSKPQVARVMKVVGGKAGAPQVNGGGGASDEGWERADAFDDDEGGWESVVSKSELASRGFGLLVPRDRFS